MRIIVAWLKDHRALVAQCLLVFALTAIATAFLVRWKVKPSAANIVYDFNSSITAPGSGPVIGDRISTELLRSLTGKTLTDEIKAHPLTIAVLVDPNCGACAAASDQILLVRAAIEQSAISYCVIMLPNGVPTNEYLEFAASLGIKDHAFFSSAKEKSNYALATMVVPSHLLIDASGTIVQKWEGTNRNRDIREGMAKQIVSDARKQLSAVESFGNH
ncbi:MAG TPA: hypothetical protein VFZ22_06425 [Pyrinomonadaceae bacterium]|nr:hypothetical protein [Pyrinomonadaceae bacterium]